jgi:hypothetical protein
VSVVQGLPGFLGRSLVAGSQKVVGLRRGNGYIGRHGAGSSGDIVAFSDHVYATEIDQKDGRRWWKSLLFVAQLKAIGNFQDHGRLIEGGCNFTSELRVRSVFVDRYLDILHQRRARISQSLTYCDFSLPLAAAWDRARRLRLRMPRELFSFSEAC